MIHNAITESYFDHHAYEMKGGVVKKIKREIIEAQDVRTFYLFTQIFRSEVERQCYIFILRSWLTLKAFAAEPFIGQL